MQQVFTSANESPAVTNATEKNSEESRDKEHARRTPVANSPRLSASSRLPRTARGGGR